MVIQDLDKDPGAGALVGDLHAAIGLALNCIGYVSNGSVRDIRDVEARGFHLFAGSVSVTHQYAHVSEFGNPVEIGGWRVSPGDLIHGDRHGVHVIPLSVASQIPHIAQKIRAEEREFTSFCESSAFSLDAMEQKFRLLPGGGFQVPIG
jgi:regulator of RNase E activity RraA